MEKETMPVVSKEIIIKEKDVTEPMMVAAAALFSAGSFFGCLVAGIPEFAITSLLGGVLGPPVVLGIQGLYAKSYRKKVKRYLGVKTVPRFGAICYEPDDFYENRNGKLTKITSPKQALGEEVYQVTFGSLMKLHLKNNSMVTWDKTLDDVKSTYHLKGKKVLAKT